MRSTSTRPQPRYPGTGNPVHPWLCRVSAPRAGISPGRPSMLGQVERRRTLPPSGGAPARALTRLRAADSIVLCSSATLTAKIFSKVIDNRIVIRQLRLAIPLNIPQLTRNTKIARPIACCCDAAEQW